jgi:hypothetical protein
MKGLTTGVNKKALPKLLGQGGDMCYTLILDLKILVNSSYLAFQVI